MKMSRKMTSTRSHGRAPLRRSSTPQRILSAGLATATCMGVVGLLGARTIEANTASAEQPDVAPPAEAPVVPVASSAQGVVTSSAGMKQADLDAYAAQLASEKERLDAYRAKLVKTAKKLNRQAAAQGVPVTSGTAASSGSWSAPQAAARPTTGTAKPKPAKPSGSSPAAAAPQQQAPQQAAPQQQAPQAPQAAAAPAAKAAPAQQQAPQQQAAQPQSTSKGS